MRKSRLLVAVAVLMSLAAVGRAGTTAGNAASTYVAGRLLVGFQPGISTTQMHSIVTSVGATELRVVGVGTHVLSVQPGTEKETIQSLLQRSEVRYANLNGYFHIVGAPNDKDFGKLWAMRNWGQTVDGVKGTPGADIKGTSAWRYATGSANVIVGVIDTGINYTHPDLVDNVWSNPGGINGCAAGTHGANVITGVDNCDPKDDNQHGSHVSGTIGAKGNNNEGVAGVNWTTSIMAIKAFNSGGGATWEDTVKAVHWAVLAKQAGVNLRVLSNSWGGTGFFQGLLDEISFADQNGILFVAAAGNNSTNIDTFPFYPASFTHNVSNIIAVAATDQKDNMASFSNYGANTVDLGAPGVNIYSTVLGSNYGFLDGTSMATPHVSGTAALILSLTDETVAQLKAQLRATVDPLGSMNGKTISGGRLNVCSAILICIATII